MKSLSATGRIATVVERPDAAVHNHAVSGPDVNALVNRRGSAQRVKARLGK